VDDKIWELALQARRKQKEKIRQKSTYFCGHVARKNGELVIHISKLEKTLPLGIFNVHEFESYPEENQSTAESILNDMTKIESAKTKPVQLNKQVELKIGSVAMHEDYGIQHMSIVLNIQQNGRVPCLIFTSLPEWKRKTTRKHRLATKEEIALAGMVITKPTYLTSSIKYVQEFCPTGAEFPIHRVKDLYLEFFPDAWDSIQDPDESD
jgi:hypothetical protein